MAKHMEINSLEGEGVHVQCIHEYLTVAYPDRDQAAYDALHDICQSIGVPFRVPQLATRSASDLLALEGLCKLAFLRGLLCYTKEVTTHVPTHPSVHHSCAS